MRAYLLLRYLHRCNARLLPQPMSPDPRPALHCQTRNHVNLIAIADPAMIFAP
jgi:hypothetical protein